jgi:hypothetical protein
MIHLSEDDDFSGSLIPSMNLQQRRFAELNFSSPSSNELNIFDSLDLKFKSRPYFFRQLTKSHCEISCEEEKNLSDKILNYFKNGAIREKLPPEKNQNTDNRENYNLNQNVINSPSMTHQNVGQNFLYLNITQEERQISPIVNHGNIIFVKEIEEQTSNKLEDSEISEGTFEKMLNTQTENGSEIKIFQKNKQRFSNLNSINFNILIVGEKGSGKTLFIRKMKHKLKNSVLKSIIKNTNSNLNSMPISEVIINSEQGQRQGESNLNSNSINILDNPLNQSQSDDLSIITNRILKPTKNFKNYKIHCSLPSINSCSRMHKLNLQNLQNSKISSKEKENSLLYDICLIDSPGYPREEDDEIRNKWLEDIKKIITNRVSHFYL